VRGFGLRVGAVAWTAAVLALALAASAFAEKPAKVDEPDKGHAYGHGGGPGKPGAEEEQGSGKANGHANAPGQVKANAPAPAPDESLPAKAEKTGPVGEQPEPRRHASAPKKVTLCHATGSATNPFVVITVSVNATTGNGHGRHEHDLLPAPTRGCPGGTDGGPEDPEDPGDPGDPGGGPDDGGENPGEGPYSHEPDPPNRSAGDPEEPVAAGPDTVPHESLPFTGLSLAWVALLGFVLLAAGFVLRRRRASWSERPTALG
jgi:hypothetical protein